MSLENGVTSMSESFIFSISQAMMLMQKTVKSLNCHFQYCQGLCLFPTADEAEVSVSNEIR